ncbi:hypothetical protein F5Y15DRAFT_413508 [Xylariaceae sp. FL0016]|nr:hypothetical protein F5Y15DRAFT_413508 [Xylariaceae sp. FL0016]
MSEDGPWKKLDPSQLRKDAEAKEAKVKRQQEQRLARMQARKEKRHLKSEAKQARKANVSRTAKWTPERRALDEEKKLANHPRKQEKRHKRLRQRAEKLEAQSKKLWEEAQKARARADLLDERKAEQEAVKSQLQNETEAMAADSHNDDYIAPGGPIDQIENVTFAKQTAEEAAKKAAKKDAKLTEKALDAIMDEELGDSITTTGLHIEAEKEKKRKKKEEIKAEKRKREEESGAQENGIVAPDGEAMDVDAVGEANTPKDKKKHKKQKREHSTEEDGVIDGVDNAGTPKSEKKKHRKRKEHAADDNEASEVVQGAQTPDKKDKKKKKKSKEIDREESAVKSKSTNQPEAAASTDGGEQWNVSALGGGDARQEKFYRLLGGKKANGVSTDRKASGSTSKSDIAKMQNDLERQFDMGIKMKNEGSHKKGLGA